jgi:ribokinase
MSNLDESVQCRRFRLPQVIVVGSINMDLIFRSRKFPSPGETIPGEDLCMVPGGKGANQACAAAILGATPCIVAQVGDDAFGRQSIDSLHKAGVNTSLIGISSRSTGTAMVNVLDDGENTILLSPGANATLTPDIALARLPSISRGDIVLLQLEVPLETVEVVVETVEAKGATVILDPAPFQSIPISLLRRVRYITPNQTECAALCSSLLQTPLDPNKSLQGIAEVIRRQGPESAILKLGSKGCYISTPSLESYIEPFAVEAIDSTAAGDVFNAAFAVALSEKQSTWESAYFANAAAALSVTKRGAQSSIPTRADVDAFLNSRRQTRLA